MKRRAFLDSAVSALAAGVVWPGLTRPRPRFAGANWTWVHGGRDRDAAGWLAAFQRLRGAGFDGVLVSGGETAMLANAAHAAGLQFHRWIWVLNRNGDEWAQAEHPEWFTVSGEGQSTLDHPPYVGYYKWVCPTRRPVREYLRGVVDRIASEPGVDGVHLDYIRFSDVILPRALWERYGLVQDREYPEFDFCYCDVCRNTFMRRGGEDPVTMTDPGANVAWREFRWRVVTELVTELSAAVRARGKEISAAVFPTPTIARRLVRQAWEQWPLDRVFPMVYHSFYEEDVPWIGRATREGVVAIGPGTSLHSGLYLPSLSPVELGAAIREARRAGAAGFSCFEMDGLTDAHLEAVRAALAH